MPQDGVFHSPEGLSLLDYGRQSRRKSPACAHGFSTEHSTNPRMALARVEAASSPLSSTGACGTRNLDL
ncbi:MAG: hypothetical protein HN380_15660 [Victivallales bacterium]|jgi:hypothetical protein|nr:hypothetical protein [Victivallales bacterium]